MITLQERIKNILINSQLSVITKEDRLVLHMKQVKEKEGLFEMLQVLNKWGLVQLVGGIPLTESGNGDLTILYIITE